MKTIKEIRESDNVLEVAEGLWVRVRAAQLLHPGARVGLFRSGDEDILAGTGYFPFLAVLDPFLEKPVGLGESCRVLLEPGRCVADISRPAHLPAGEDGLPVLPVLPRNFPPSSAWRTGGLLARCRAMRRSGNYAPLAELAVTLEKEGCQDQDLLRVMRHPSRSPLGSLWVITRILGTGEDAGISPEDWFIERKSYAAQPSADASSQRDSDLPGAGDGTL